MPEFQTVVFISEYLKISDIDFFHLHSLNTRNRSLLPNNMRTRVNWLAVTSHNRVKGHIMWINVSLDNDYLLIIENIWKNCN